MSSQTLPNQGLPEVSIRSPNKYKPDIWVNKPHPLFGFLEVQARGGLEKGWLQFLHPQGFLIFGRDLGAAHIFVGHPSVSNQHAVAAWDVRDGKCYLLDLESEHGTFVNDQVIDHSVPFELRPGARVRFGHSAHIYVFNKLPEELVDPTLEAPTVDRSLDTRTEASQPSRYDDRFDRPPPPPFHSDRPPSDMRPPPDMDRMPPLDLDRRALPPDMDRRPPPDMDRRPPPDMDRRPPPDMDRRPPPDMDRRPPPDMDRRPPSDMGRLSPDRGPRGGPPQERWSPRRGFDDRRADGPPPERFDDRRYDGPPHTPSPRMGPGSRPPRNARSPRGRGSPHMGLPRSPRYNGRGRGRSPRDW